MHVPRASRPDQGEAERRAESCGWAEHPPDSCHAMPCHAMLCYAML